MSDTWHKRQYEAALEFAGFKGPAWDDLPEENKEKIRQANIEHQKFMDALGRAIAAGGPLPSPFSNSNKKEST